MVQLPILPQHAILPIFATILYAMEETPNSPLKVNDGIEQPDQLNPAAIDKLKQLRRELQPLNYYVDGILSRDIVILSKAITLIESSLAAHQQLGQDILTACLPHSGKAVRVGITGVPGAGKSTFIEALGMQLLSKGHKVAVLTIDPSSQRSKGSILGDKTRMEQLSSQPNAYIRPSASAGTLGGVARKTRESMILCEAAGFDTILVETVGVGQSETAVHAMVDFFMLLMIGGAGDELQGIKRGIMEMADGIVINKADGDNINRANRAMAECKNALHLFPPAESGINPQVTTCSSLQHTNIEGVWEMVSTYVAQTKSNGFFEKKRRRQAIDIMHGFIDDEIRRLLLEKESVNQLLPLLENKVRNNEMSAYLAAKKVLQAFFKNPDA
jgi:LAO/AO transport system kinase